MSPTCANRPVWQMIIVTLLQRQYENESQMLTQITYVHTSVSALSFYAGNAFGQLFVLSTALRERSTVLNSMQTLPVFMGDELGLSTACKPSFTQKNLPF